MGEDWVRVGERVKLRRGELGYRRQEDVAKLAGVGVTTWRLIEGGKEDGFTVPIKAAVARVLLWGPDGLDRIARGEEPDDLRLDARVSAVEERLERVEESVGAVLQRLDGLGVPE